MRRVGTTCTNDAAKKRYALENTELSIYISGCFSLKHPIQ